MVRSGTTALSLRSGAPSPLQRILLRLTGNMVTGSPPYAERLPLYRGYPALVAGSSAHYDFASLMLPFVGDRVDRFARPEEHDTAANGLLNGPPRSVSRVFLSLPSRTRYVLACEPGLFSYVP